jgi:glutathione S-transferase
VRLAGHFALIDGYLAAHGKPYFLGAAVSTVDFYMHMLARWSRYQTKPAYAYPAIRRLTDAMKARPSVGRMMAMQDIAESEKA